MSNTPGPVRFDNVMPQNGRDNLDIQFGEQDRGRRPIDLLTPNSDRHAAVLKYLVDRLEASEKAMSQRYSRWRLNETQFQAYIDLREHEKILKEARGKKGMPELNSLVIPYTYSTIMSIVTYLLQVFAGRDPMFQVDTLRAENMQAAPYMELALKHNAQHSRMVAKLFQFLLDGQVYNLSIMRNLWTVEERLTTVFRSPSMMGPLGAMPDFSQGRQKMRENRIVFEGTNVVNVDPFMFFPDPRVAFTEVNKKGEFVFWRDFDGLHSLKKQEARGLISYLDRIGERPKASTPSTGGSPQSNRNNGSAGNTATNMWRSTQQGLDDFVQLDQGTVEIIPNSLGLGDSKVPEKWLFTIANKRQIIQAEPLDLDHDMHPIVVSEPYSMGYTPGGLSMPEMLEPIQEGMSWLLNSHIHNVRGIINNSFIVDPMAIDMASFKDGKPGRLIKLKPSAIGRDVRTAVQQLTMYDVTQQHIGDIQVMQRIGDTVSAVNDTMRGVQQAGGRKTATEVRTSTDNGASRLVTTARLISAQAMVDLGEQMASNMQQNMSEPFMVTLLGDQGRQRLVSISPEQLVGSFNFPVHDGTLPMDKIAILDVWKEIFMAVSGNPMLAQQYSIDQIFEFVAELSGARNISRFKMQPQIPGGMPGMPPGPEQMMQQQEAGNVVPLFPPGGTGVPGGRGIPDFAGA